MAPTPQVIPVGHGRENHGVNLADGERVVISGVSGAYPQSHNVKELSEILYNKVNPILSENNKIRWNYNHPEVPQHAGIIPELEKFDAQFFKVHYRLGFAMDPMARKILEHTYQAIFDAGVNPANLSGKKVAVYTGSCVSETEKTLFYNNSVIGKTGFGIVGCNKSMFANRISYWLNAKGPSLSIDAACCSSAVALEQAHHAISRGDCEAAIVGACNVCLHPQTSLQYGRNIQLSKDGKNKSYDQTAEGSVRSEAINVLFLQKAKDALRIYAEIIHVKSEYGSLNSTGTFKRDHLHWSRFLKGFYDEVKISPTDVKYVEGFGAADSGTDKTELEVLDDVFCQDRAEPLYVGSVMSNVGYCEAASSVAGITKVLLGYHTGQLAGNLHYTNPRDDIEALREGRISIVADHMSVPGKYTAVNGLSITGINTHVLLSGHYKQKDLTQYQAAFPRLVLISSRIDTGVQRVIDDLKSRSIDAEELALLQKIYFSKLNGHLGRGFTILDTDKESKTISLCEKTEYFDGGNRPLWFVYSGMGSQWAEMGAQLMRIPIFAAAIERCRQALEPKGIDIVHIITAPDKTIYDNILHSFVGIAAVQIGLTDILREMGLVPDKIIGHSVGELGCAYADGCLTAEEMILSAYSRGLVSIQTPFIRGSMAAVGIGYNEIKNMCPPEIEVACHNSSTSSTISGPAEVMAEFVAQLTAKGIFAKEVPCSNIAYHSRYISKAGPGLLSYLKEVIKTPKLRSERWVSTSVPQKRWDEDLAKYSSAEYHTNNLLSPVLFEETARLIPSDAVVVEVAPHGLLQAILRRSLPKCVHIPLTRRGHDDNARFFLEAVGKLYMEGYYPDISTIYPKVKFPVSTGTPHLSHLVGWAHQDEWHLAEYQGADRSSSSTCTFRISLHDDDSSFLNGHQINGKTLFPFASVLVAAWDTLAMSTKATRGALPVEFRDVSLFAQPVLHDSRLLRLSVSLHPGTGCFEINDDVTTVASGFVIPIEEVKTPEKSEAIANGEEISIPEKNHGNQISDETIILNSAEIYQILNERGYMYRDQFKSICEADASFSEGRVAWTGSWVTCLDSIMQLHALRLPHDGVSQPMFIRRIKIDTDLHSKLSETASLEVKVDTIHDITKCGGITFEGMQYRNIERSDENSLILNTSQLNPRRQTANLVHGETKDNSRYIKVLQSTRVEDFESLQWVDAASSEATNSDSIKVNFAGLNATDVLKATGKISFKNEHYTGQGCYGMDFSGTTKTGQRVMGVVREGAASECVHASPLLWPVPEHWSLEDAATVPLPYAHAYYCLAIKSQLKPSFNILVSGGAGATGQAIISLALHAKCRVFVVVRHFMKKQFLMKMFPQLNADDIFCSRDASFTDGVLIATGGKGCSIVICGKGDTKEAYLKCCGSFGYVLDIHQLKENEYFDFGMNTLTMERSYIRLDFSSVFQDIGMLKKLQSLVAEGISSGAVRPLSRVVYEPQDASRAFYLLSSSQYRGRVLLRIQSTSQSTEKDVTSVINCSADGCQLLISDDVGLAIHLANRLVQRGARALHLQIENTSTRLRLAIESWRKANVNISTSSENLKNKKCVSDILKLSSQLGQVEGIFIIVAKPETDLASYKSLVENLDTESRKQDPFIKNFAIIGINNAVGEPVCVSRAGNKLPAMMLSVVINKKVDDESITNVLSASYNDIVNTIEKGLGTMQPVIIAQRPRAVKEPPLLQQIAKLAGLSIPENATKNNTLQDFGITMGSLQVVAAFLRDKQNLFISEEEVALLTIERIHQIDTTLKKSDFSAPQGLKAFFPSICPDELSVTIQSVMLPTRTVQSDVRDDEFTTEACLYILPSMQGMHQPYKEMCERLQMAANVLQLGLDQPNESIQEMTERFATALLKKKIDNKPFYLLGHELGVIVALNVAAILEDNGLTGTVFCLGGGPDEFQYELEQQLRGIDTEEELQEAVASHMCALMGVQSAQLDAALREAPTWQQKVEASINALRGRVAHSTQYARLLIESAYKRMEQARNYVQPAPRALQSRVVLLRSPSAHTLEPHPLQRYSRQPLQVHSLHAPLTRAADDLRIAAIVNGYLDEEAKKYFAGLNLCDSYLLNKDTFISNRELARRYKAPH